MEVLIMNREELIKRQQELNEEWAVMAKRWIASDFKRTKEDKKREWEIIKENKEIQRELDKLDGKTYNNEKWITKFVGESYETLKAARFDLINKIKNLPGVKVGEDKTGVVSVTVYTEYKIYYYTIHAHYRVEEYNPHIGKDIFGNETTVYDTRNIYQAWVDGSGNNWSWRY